MLRAAQHDNTVERVSLPVFLVILRREMDPTQGSSGQNEKAVGLEPYILYDPPFEGDLYLKRIAVKYWLSMRSS